MNILIVTPLFPPDTSASAKYVKTLAAKLSDSHSVTVLHFGRLPEQVTGVIYISISKKLFITRRIWNMLRMIVRNMGWADVILIHNGPSVELPALLATFISKRNIVYIISDQAAYMKTSHRSLQRFITNWLQKRAATVCNVTTIDQLLPPLVHPLEKIDTDVQTNHVNAWKQHLHTLQSTHLV